MNNDSTNAQRTATVAQTAWKGVLNFLWELPGHARTEVQIKSTTDRWKMNVARSEEQGTPIQTINIGVSLYDLSW